MSNETFPVMVKRIELDLALEQVKAQLRGEFVANIDRIALERAIDDARTAQEKADAARAVSLRWYLKLIIVIGVLYVAVAMLLAFASENRDRLKRLERQVDPGEIR